MFISTRRTLLLFLALTVSASAQPCLYVDGLHFGDLKVGQSRTRDLELCNHGTGEITFQEPWLTQYDSEHFTIEESQLDILRNTTLGSHQCITIKVTFKADEGGDYRTVGRFWASTRDCVDTSIWTATVVKPIPVLTSMLWNKRWLTTPNSCTKSGIDCYEGEVELSNVGSEAFEVAAMAIVDDDDGTVDDAPYYDRVRTDPTRDIVISDIIQPGQSRKQKLCFRPDAEREYRARIRIVTGHGDIVYGALRGTGIESHLEVPAQATFPLTDAGQTSEPLLVQVASRTTAGSPLTISEFKLANGTVGVGAGDFLIGAPIMSDGSPQVIGPWVLTPGDFLQLPIKFVSRHAGTKVDTLVIIGDHSRCDDSTVTLIAPATSSITGSDIRSGNALGQNDPNPVIAETRIEFRVAHAGHTRLEIFDSKGTRVASILDGYREAGTHHVIWNPDGLPAGVYSYRITHGEWSSARQLVLVR